VVITPVPMISAVYQRRRAERAAGMPGQPKPPSLVMVTTVGTPRDIRLTLCLVLSKRAAAAIRKRSPQTKSIRKTQPAVGLSFTGQPGWMPASQLISAPSCIASP